LRVSAEPAPPWHRRVARAALLAARAALLALLVLVPAVAAAAESPTGPWTDSWMQLRQPTTDWFGYRDVLAAWGITPSVRYATDLQANVLGGLRRGKAYAGELSVDLDFDLDRIARIRGLRLHASGDWTTGTDLSHDVGNVFTVAQFFEGRQARLYTLFLQQSLLDGRLDIKVGRFGTGDNFLTSPIDVEVVNEALNPMVVGLQLNVPGVTAEPNATWGGLVIGRPTDTVSLALGAFYSDPTLDQLTANGTEFGIDRKAGYFLIGEAAYYLNQTKGATGRPGRYRLGAYYDSNRYAYLDNRQRSERGNFGLYVLGEQMVYREGESEKERTQGLTLFGGLIYAPRERVNTMPYFVSAGASYRGLVPRRDEDTAVFALYYGGFSRHLPGQTYEMTLEWTYVINVAPWLSVHPDVQYVIQPSGRATIPNALVVGAQFWLTF
jgi:porin